MNKQLIFSYISSALLLLISTAAVVIAGCFYPERHSLMYTALAFLGAAIVLFICITCRSLLLPLLHLDQRTSVILSSLGEDAPESSSSILERFQSLMEREYNTRASFRQAELDALQSQINPHFLYNTLECIRGQAMIEGNRAIADMARSLSQFFRYSINHTNALVTVADELKNVAAYMKIQNYRFGEKYDVRIHMDAADREIIQLCLLPRLTLQPIIENALLHGLSNSTKPMEYLDISFELTDVRLVISVEDHGTGMSEQQLEQLNEAMYGDAPPQPSAKRHNGIALPNINERIQLLFGPEYGLRIYSTLGVGCTVEAVLPIRKAEVAVPSQYHP